MKDKIFLIGYRATGKSAVGKLLADALGWTFRDLDDWVEERAGMSISEMVRKQGWSFFRQKEKEALGETLHESGNMVVACGGGAVLHEELWPEILSRCEVIWLRAAKETISSRMLRDPRSESTRPALEPDKGLLDEIETTLKAREPLYQAYSHMAVDTDHKPPLEIAREILDAIGVERARK